jgi:hypothetical protein
MTELCVLAWRRPSRSAAVQRAARPSRSERFASGLPNCSAAPAAVEIPQNCVAVSTERYSSVGQA